MTNVMRQIALIIIIFVTVIMDSCNSSNKCEIIFMSQYEGDGIVLLENASMQDGRTFITFFPSCKLDTANLLSSLQQSRQGIIFRIDAKLVRQAIHKRVVILQSLDKHRLRFNREVYLTPVHLAYHEIEEKHAEPSKATFQRVLNTEQFSHNYHAREITDLKIDKFEGI